MGTTAENAAPFTSTLFLPPLKHVVIGTFSENTVDQLALCLLPLYDDEISPKQNDVKADKIK